MDISFEIEDSKGDLVRVALSYYSSEVVEALTADLKALTLTFYDVTLIREGGRSTVDYKLLQKVSHTLANFLDENEDAVLCFYCDDLTDVARHHLNITPQEYRSRLFSRMFDRYIQTTGIDNYTNHRIKTFIDKKPIFAHFICRKEYLSTIEPIGEIIIQSK